MNIDLSDVLIMMGVVCLALAVGLSFGWVGVLGYAGAILMMLGLAMARRETHDKATTR